MGNAQTRGAKPLRQVFKEKVMAFYLIDMGVKMSEVGKAVETELKKDGHHIVVYLTDMPTLLCVEELNEDQFLDHFKNTKLNGKT
jgi:hypothetical protein